MAFDKFFFNRIGAPLSFQALSFRGSLTVVPADLLNGKIRVFFARQIVEICLV